MLLLFGALRFGRRHSAVIAPPCSNSLGVLYQVHGCRQQSGDEQGVRNGAIGVHNEVLIAPRSETCGSG
jgi:hypothetical protein